jgi:hypothetical protein
VGFERRNDELQHVVHTGKLRVANMQSTKRVATSSVSTVRHSNLVILKLEGRNINLHLSVAAEVRQSTHPPPKLVRHTCRSLVPLSDVIGRNLRKKCPDEIEFCGIPAGPSGCNLDVPEHRTSNILIPCRMRPESESGSPPSRDHLLAHHCHGEVHRESARKAREVVIMSVYVRLQRPL